MAQSNAGFVRTQKTKEKPCKDSSKLYNGKQWKRNSDKRSFV